MESPIAPQNTEIDLPRLDGQVALVTGGTMGIGLGCGLALARAGVRCILTYKWGGADDQAIVRAFRDAGAPPPQIIRCDAADPAEVAALAEEIRKRHGRLDIFVSNVAFARGIRSLGDYSRAGLIRSAAVSAWPLVSHLDAFEAAGLPPPPRVVAISSSGSRKFFPQYDEAAASKSVLESLARSLQSRLRGRSRLFVVRAGFVDTESSRLILGERFPEVSGSRALAPFHMAPGEIGAAVRALCGEHCNGLAGGIITVDRGLLFAATALDNAARQPEHGREKSI